MIETVTSPAAQIASNARAALAKIADEAAELYAGIEAMRDEQSALEAERAAYLQNSPAHASLVEASAADMRKAALQLELAAGTTLEAQAREQAAQVSRTWDAARADATAHENAGHARGPEIASRLDYLARSIAESGEMLAGLQSRQGEIQAIADQAYAEVGRDVASAIASERNLLEVEEAEAQALLADVQARKQAHAEQIAPRLLAWPALAREACEKYLQVDPGPTARALSAQRELMLIVGEDINRLDLNLLQAYLTRQSLPMWHLSQYGPRSKYLPNIDKPGKVDDELKIFEKMLVTIAQAVENCAAREKSAHIDTLLRQQAAPGA